METEYHKKQRKATYLTSYGNISMPKIPTEAEKRISAEFQARLTELMDELDTTKIEFAKKVHVSEAVITRAVIYGIVPSLKILVRIADCLNVSLPYLLGETDDAAFYPAEPQIGFHARLDGLAEEKNVKYSQIAHKMPFTKNFFYEWQRVKTLPSLDYLRALADYFDVSIDYLLGRTDYRK